MEKIELEIAKVNSDIETVTKQIETIGGKADKAEIAVEEWKQRNNWNENSALTLQNNAFYQDLREKENKLREKENKLREKENKLNDILLEKERQRTQGMLITEPVFGRSFENTFRISFIKALFNEGKGVVVSSRYFESKTASRRYTNKTDPELMDQCRARLKMLKWKENLLKFEDIEIDCVLKCYFKEGCSREFAEPAKLLLPKNLNQCGVITR
jgi:hypothetical protein